MVSLIRAIKTDQRTSIEKKENLSRLYKIQPNTGRSLRHNNQRDKLHDPNGDVWYLTDNVIHFAGKSGIGDVMLGLNTAFYCAYILKKKLR